MSKLTLSNKITILYFTNQIKTNKKTKKNTENKKKSKSKGNINKYKTHSYQIISYI